MTKPVSVLLAASAVVAAVALSVQAYESVRSNATPALSNQYHAVLLVNGAAFFGHIDNLQSEHPVLTDVFYIQTRTNPDTKQASSVLVKRGSEWHSPDRMILNKRTVLLIEPVKEDSQVAKLIAEQSKPR